MYSTLKSAFFTAAMLASVATAAPIERRGNPGGVQFLYWGADSRESTSIKTYCDKSQADIINIGFVNKFGSQKALEATFGACSVKDGKASNCDTLGSDIKSCQSSGVKVLVSVGGWGDPEPSQAYGLKDQDDAEDLANQLWNLFGGGDSNVFGGNSVDGVDLDIEGDTGSQYYQYTVSKYRSLAGSHSAIFTAAPMCSTDADPNISDALQNAQFDYVNVQFYNNKNSAKSEIEGRGDMLFDQIYKKLGKSKSGKINIGLVAPGGTTNTQDDDISPSDAKKIINKYASHPGFGGTMIWSAGYSDKGASGGCSYAKNIKSILTGDKTC